MAVSLDKKLAVSLVKLALSEFSGSPIRNNSSIFVSGGVQELRQILRGGGSDKGINLDAMSQMFQERRDLSGLKDFARLISEQNGFVPSEKPESASGMKQETRHDQVVKKQWHFFPATMKQERRDPGRRSSNSGCGGRDVYASPSLESTQARRDAILRKEARSLGRKRISLLKDQSRYQLHQAELLQKKSSKMAKIGDITRVIFGAMRMFSV